uniref:Uncharacterized protein n=1 Tax=Anguilla anguilla TaxID=7936 RepID=A0A0E9Y090_ANGAN
MIDFCTCKGVWWCIYLLVDLFLTK